MVNVIITLLVAIVGIALGWTARWLYAKFKLTSIEQKAARLDAEAVKEAEVFGYQIYRTDSSILVMKIA